MSPSIFLANYHILIVILYLKLHLVIYSVRNLKTFKIILYLISVYSQLTAIITRKFYSEQQINEIAEHSLKKSTDEFGFIPFQFVLLIYL